MNTLSIDDRRQALAAFLNALDQAAPDQMADIVRDHLSSDAVIHACHPFNQLSGATVAEALYRPMASALINRKRRLYALMAGDFAGGAWTCAMGVIDAAFHGTLFGARGTGEFVQLRFGEFHRFEDDRIIESVILWDAVDFLRQVGINPLPAPPAGAASIFPPPLVPQRALDTAAWAASTPAALTLVEDMIFGLKRFDGANLKSMGMTRFWAPDMAWYGPGGIGAARALSGFETYHQRPFLTAFPDRVGGHHKARFADGDFVASTGWPSIKATFAAPWLGVKETGGPITMRVMDWWRCEGGVLAENWVFIDIPDLMRQAGVDPFADLSLA